MTTTDRRGIGHNRPSGEDVAKRLAEEYASAESRTKQLLDAARALPLSVTDEDTLEKLSRVVQDLQAHDKLVEEQREAEKAVYLAGGRAVDKHFNPIRERLGRAIRLLLLRANEYQQDKLERERAKREAAERRAFEEARRLEEEAQKAASAKRKAELSLDAKMAQQRAAMAQAQAEAAQAKPAEVVRTHFESGPLVTMQRTPTATVTDYDALPLDKLRPHIKRDALDAAVRAWARTTGYNEPMAGVAIEHATKTVIK